MGALSPVHWLIIILVVVILFGSSRLPGAARGLGRSLRIFKSEIKEMQGDGAQQSPTSANPQQPAPPQPLPPQSVTPPPAPQQPAADPHEHRSY